MTEISFRQRVRSRQRLAGTFVKTASHQTVEVLGTSALDFAVIDAEHAPFGVNTLDTCLLAAHATRLDTLVRIPDAQPGTILQVLDMGATGLLVPHARSVESVREVVASARYRNGTRGFSNSSRAGRYGTVAMQALIEQADRDTTLIFQIEDREAIECIDDLAAMDEVDGFLIGRADLAVSYGLSDPAHADVQAAARRVCEACATAGKAVGLFVADAREIGTWLPLGASFFIVGSDQSFLRAQANAVAAQVRAAT